MATRYEVTSFEAGSAFSDAIELGPHTRIVGIIIPAEFEGNAIGVEIKPNVDGENNWHRIYDAVTGDMAVAARIHPTGFYIINDFNHPLSDVEDDKVRLVSLDANNADKPQSVARKLFLCLSQGS